MKAIFASRGCDKITLMDESQDPEEMNEDILFELCGNLCYPYDTGGLGLTETPLTNQGLLIQFFDFLIAEVFLHEIYCAAII